MKKKREKCVISENYKLQIPSEFSFDDSGIQSLIEKLRNSDSFEVQQQIITELATYFKKETSDNNKQLICKLFVYIFLTVNQKLPIKKTIVRILNGLDSEEIETYLAGYLLKFIETTTHTDNYKTHNEICSYILSCTENYPPGLRAVSSVAGELFEFTVGFLKKLVVYVMSDKMTTVQIKQDTFLFIHNTTRVLLFLIQKCSVDKYLLEISVGIVKNCWSILNNNEFAFDTKKNCALIIVYSFHLLPSSFTDNFVFKTYPALELLACSSDSGHCIQALGIRNYCNDHTVKLAVYCGILNIVPKTVLLSESIGDVPVIAYLFNEIIDSLNVTVSVSSQILEVSHALTLLSKSLDKMPLETLIPLFYDGLNYVWTHLDHYMDTVRHMTKTVFRSFIQLANLHKQTENDCLLRKIFDDINAMSSSSVTRYIALYILASETSCSSLLVNMKLQLPQQMLENLKDPTLAQQIYTLYEYLMEKHFIELTPQYEDVWLLQWFKIILPYLRYEVKTPVNYYQKLVIAAFKINPTIIKYMMHFQYKSSAAELGTLLGCLRVARKSGIPVDLEECTSCLIQHRTLEVNVFHQEDEIRVSVLAFVVESQKSTELFTEGELEFLRKYLYYNVAAQAAATRKEIVQLYKKAFTRMKEGMAVLNRRIKSETTNGQMAEPQKPIVKCPMQIQYDIEGMRSLTVADDGSEAMKTKNSYTNFLKRLLRESLLPGLLEDANLYRRSACLELLVFFHETFTEKEWKDMWFNDDVFNLKFTIIFDTYETNKQMAVKLYKTIVPDKVKKSKEQVIQDFKNTLALASVPCNSTAAACMFEIFLISPHALAAIQDVANTKQNTTGNALADLIFFLLNELESKFARENCLQVDKSFCTYGLVVSVRHLLGKVNFLEHTQFWQNVLTNHLIHLCFTIYERVGPVVTNPSPEGNLPDDCDIFLDGEEIDESSKAQALLVFAWRNVKEISHLLGDIAARAVACENEIQLIEDDVLLKIGDFFIDLFVRTKHRGVFEQAYLGFYKLCEAFWRSNNLKLKELPEFWLNKMLNILSGNIDETCDTLCATRRSAGLPFLILAVLGTEPTQRANRSFHNCTKTLLNTANDLTPENHERRTHCMNVLRAVYRHNQLGELVSQYVGAGMIAAITGVKSTVWGVRNSATLLFSALVTRMFGVQRTRDSESLSIKNKLTIKVFFMRYPELHEFLLSELLEGYTDSSSLTLYPVLLILSRLYPSNLDNTGIFLEEYLSLIISCLSHPNYRTRELAALASLSFISPADDIKHILRLIFLLANATLGNNEVHGYLLQLLHLLKKYRGYCFNINRSKICEPTFWILGATGKRITYVTGALYLEVLVRLISVFKNSMVKDGTFTTLSEILEPFIRMSFPTSELSAREFLINVHYVKMYIVTMLPMYHNVMAVVAAREIRLNLYSDYQCITAFYLNFIAYLNFDKANYPKHCLYVTEEIEISEKEYHLAQAFPKEFRRPLLRHLHPFLSEAFVLNLDNFLKSDECRLPALLVLRYYPCIIGALCLLVNIFDYFLSLNICDDEECISAVISCLSSFVRKCKISNLKNVKFERFIQFLMASCSPTVALHRRLAVADLLVQNRAMYFSKEMHSSNEQLCDVWDMIMILLEDDDVLVRNTVSKLNTRNESTTKIIAKIGLNTTAERAREDLLMILRTMLPITDFAAFLIKWSLRHKTDDINNDDMSVVFPTGQQNLFAETTPVAKVTIKILKDVLWSLEDGLNYEDKSIFIEEKALIVTWTLINAASRQMPMVAQDTRKALLCILQAILQFLESCQINKPFFKTNFRKIMLKEQMSNGLMKLLNKNSLHNLRIFLWTIYSPILSS